MKPTGSGLPQQVDDRQSSPLGHAALALAAKGLAVFPVWPRTKNPFSSHGVKDATTRPEPIRGWWGAKPDLNVAIATGAVSGIWVLDVDGDEGEATLRGLEAEHGALPPTVEVITGKGRHLYFRWPTGEEVRNAQCRDDLPGLDWRGVNGYVLAPPSVHPSGRIYRWSVDSAESFDDAPDWLLDLVTNKKTASAGGTARAPEDWRTFIGEQVDGSRRGGAIARLFGLLVRKKIDPLVALDIVKMFNRERCSPPLDDEEVVRIANDIARREAARRRA